jgi:succinate dehydrogenase / fumarate reductase cytochrome b subunit
MEDGEKPEEASGTERPSAEQRTTQSAAPAGPGRRLHTLAGGLALGVFLVLHLLTNASALGGPGMYDAIAGAIARSKLLIVLELCILVPLVFHFGYGLELLRRRATPDAESDRYGDRRLWVVQRVGATFVLAFIVGHIWELRGQRLFFGLSESALYTVLAAHLSWTWGGVPWIALAYLVGIGAVAFHFSSGLFAATATWRILTDPAGRRRMRIATVALGALLFLLGAATVIALATGTRLLPAGDADSPWNAPCGTAAPAAPQPGPSR